MNESEETGKEEQVSPPGDIGAVVLSHIPGGGDTAPFVQGLEGTVGDIATAQEARLLEARSSNAEAGELARRSAKAAGDRKGTGWYVRSEFVSVCKREQVKRGRARTPSYAPSAYGHNAMHAGMRCPCNRCLDLSTNRSTTSCAQRIRSTQHAWVHRLRRHFAKRSKKIC
jgi:hypothetical protein